jgi:hypothetical protein
MNDQQYAIPQAAQDTAVGNALANLTPQLWAVAGLLLVGMFAAMCVVGIWRTILPNVDGDGPKAWEARKLYLTRLGIIVGGVMTFWIEWAYLAVLVDLTWVLAVPTSLLAAIIAAACNKPAYKPVRALWRWLLAKLRKRIEADGGSAADLDDTNFKPPKDQ